MTDISGAMLLPACYPHSVSPVQMLETHISRVFLTGAFAYKTKKPVDLGFLDFTTLERRRFYCEEELRLNRRTAPHLYLDVVPVVSSADGIRVGGAGTVIDYAVRMRQFPQDALLDRMAQRGALERRHIDDVADAVARFHAGAQRRPGVPDGALCLALENFDSIASRAGDRLKRWTIDEHRRLWAAFEDRRRDGVRECHGDLHLGNIAWLDGRAVPFDCIEFSEELRWIDVMAEVGFVTMDLADHRLPWLAHRFLNHYLEISGDYGGLAVLRFYEVYRAVVRAKVALLRAAQCTPGSSEAKQAQGDVDRRLTLAETLARSASPALVVMHGLSGSGKTTVSQGIVEHFGAVRVRSDVERKRLHGLGALESSRSAPGAGLYARDVSTRTYDRLAEVARLILASGRVAVIDAAFLERARRDAFRLMARDAGVPFVIVHCDVPVDELRQRVALRQRARSDASEAGIEVLELQLANRQPLAANEADETVVVRPYDSLLPGFPAGERLAQRLHREDERDHAAH
jgi:uncharacterized protein